jgi:hypothetical protein
LKVIEAGEFELSSLYLIDPSEWGARTFGVLQRKTAGFSARTGEFLLGPGGLHHPVTELTCARSTPDTCGT